VRAWCAPDRPDQAALRRPRLGYAGPIDDRLDRTLLAAVAARRPDWSLVLIGPLADARALPAAPNIHHLGMKSHEELPDYLGGWDAAMLPLARPPGPRFLGPIATPEYLAAGLPVVSTPINDVVRPYGVNGLVKIAETPEAFVAAAQAALAMDRARHRAHADAFLAGSSWDETAASLEEVLAVAWAADSGARAPVVA
jgi:glycosyltransferase involved in cell wall biosynthesis